MKAQDEKILLRLPAVLLAATDQVLKEELPELNRSVFIRRAVRFTLDNLALFKASDASSVGETQGIDSVEKINAVRDLREQLLKYKDQLQKEPSTPNTIKQLSFLIFLIGEMIFRMND